MDNNVSDYEALIVAKQLIEDRIGTIVNDRNRRILESDKWYLTSKTKRLASYFAGLGYRILDCKPKETKSTYVRVAILLFNNRVRAIPLVKKLAHMKENAYTFSFDEMSGMEKNGLIQLCGAFEKCGWVSCEKSKNELKIICLDKKSAVPFWNGAWAELVNKRIVEKTLEDYARQKRLKFYVFTDVKLAKIEQEKRQPDMQLDVVAMLQDRVYVFETKTGKMLGLDKWVDRARMFCSDMRSRFVTCCADDNVPCNLFKPFDMVPLSSLDKWLWRCLEKDRSAGVSPC